MTEQQKEQAAKALGEVMWGYDRGLMDLELLTVKLAKVGLCITEKDAPSEAASAIHCSACGEPLICEDQRAVHRCPNPQSKPQSK